MQGGSRGHFWRLCTIIASPCMTFQLLGLLCGFYMLSKLRWAESGVGKAQGGDRSSSRLLNKSFQAAQPSDQ